VSDVLWAGISIEVSPALGGAIIGLAGVVAGLWVNGDRTERQRKRDLHGRALAAILAYGEMPFMIRRRRWEGDEQSAERVRLSDHFSAVKAEVATCEVVLAADGDEKLAASYTELVEVARATAGREAHEAWKQPAIKSDAEMNMGGLFDSLADFHTQLTVFESALARATLPRRKRVARAVRGWRRGRS
jgi:hypothetical protein